MELSELGAYRVLDKLGAGGMGEVYLAEDTRLGRKVAIKVLPTAFATDEERLSRLRREAKLLAQLSHQNIAQLHGLEKHEDTWFLVMELADGGTLEERIQLNGPLPLTEVLPIATQLCAGLAAAHEQGIVHRDLKPANIIVSEDSAGSLHVKILDFGLAKSVVEGSDQGLSASPTEIAATREGVIQGTAPYMSPEQARGKPADRRTDIWAFGCVLYEMLTTRRAFNGETVSDVITAILSAEPDTRALPAGTPPSLRRLLRRCLEKDPELRLRDVGDARLELRDTVGEIVGAATGAPSATGRRGGFWVATTLALGIALAAGALVGRQFFAGNSPPTPPSRLIQFSFSGNDFSPAASPDGRLIAFASDRGGRTQIWLQQRVGGGAAPLTAGEDVAPRFSPDGTSVLFTRLESDGGPALYRIALVGGQPRKLIEGGALGDWSPDGARLAYIRPDASAGDRLMIADVDGSNERELLLAPNRRLAHPRFSPAGDRLSVTRFTLSGVDHGVVLVDIDTGNVRPLATDSDARRLSGTAWNHSGTALMYATALSTIGDRDGQAAPVIWHELSTDRRRILFWVHGLFPQGAGGYEMPGFDRLDDNSLLFFTAVSAQNLYEVDLQQAQPDQLGRKITRGDGQDRQPVYSPDGRQVLFSSNRSGNLDLWVYDRNDGIATQLTDDPANDWDPSYDADGAIWWSSDRSGVLEIWTADADGASARQVTHTNIDAQNPAVSSDGQWVYYVSTRTDAPGVYRIRTDGTEDELVRAGAVIVPALSPDDTILQYTFPAVVGESARAEFYALDTREILGDTSMQVSSRNIGGGTGRGRWMSDDLIALAGSDEMGRNGLFTQRFERGRETRATRKRLVGFSPDGEVETFGLSADGRWAVLSVQSTVRKILIVTDLTGLED